MAKYERHFRGNFDEVLRRLDKGILEGSASASFEDRCAVRVYERYSVVGGNRVSLNLTLAGEGEDLFLSAITSGGSQAMLFKINTWGEEAFLDQVQALAEGL